MPTKETVPTEKRHTPVNIDDNAAAFMAAVYARMPQKTTKPKTAEKPGMNFSKSYLILPEQAC
jgi:hypothetical protein